MRKLFGLYIPQKIRLVFVPINPFQELMKDLGFRIYDFRFILDSCLLILESGVAINLFRSQCINRKRSQPMPAFIRIADHIFQRKSNMLIGYIF